MSAAAVSEVPAFPPGVVRIAQAVCAEGIRSVWQFDQLVGVVRTLAAVLPLDNVLGEEPATECRFCGGFTVVPIQEFTDPRIFPHKQSCPWVRASLLCAELVPLEGT